jgi:formate dehydrogenase iron-sulfur subunit
MTRCVRAGRSADMVSLFENDFCMAAASFKGVQRRDSYLKNQERLTFARVGVVDPVSLADYLNYMRLRQTYQRQMDGAMRVQAVIDSGLAVVEARRFRRHRGDHGNPG